MIFKDFNPNIHNLDKIANLVYDVDFRTYELFFKEKDKAIKAIKRNLKNEFPNDSDYFKMKVILVNNEIVGFFLYYTKRKNDFFKNTLFLFKNQSLSDAIKLIFINILDFFVLADFTSSDVYLAEFAIDSSMRGEGLGGDALKLIIAKFKIDNFKKLILDVDFKNENAKALYEKIGFKVFNKKRVKVFNFVRGMYNMEYILN